MKRKPLAVLISDIHFNINTIQIAIRALRQAIYKSNDLNIPMIVAGDLHDTKANLRGECVSAMIETFQMCNIKPYIIRGNHDQLNEKSTLHSIKFLMAYANIVDFRGRTDPNGNLRVYMIPYHHNPDELRVYLKTIPDGSTLIMHQGIEGSNSGEYIQDKSAINHNDVSNFRVISGHYHTRQNIRTGRPRKGAIGLWSYIGNPFTLNFAEASDPEKGFQILMDDGSLEFVPTNLRKHIVLNIEYVPHSSTWQITGKVPVEDIREDDLVLVKVKGTKEELSKATKQFISKLIYRENFRLDLIPTNPKQGYNSQTNPILGNTELLDSLIDSTNTSDGCKLRLKQSWRDLV